MAQNNVNVKSKLRRALVNKGSRIAVDDNGQLLINAFIPTIGHSRLSVVVIGACQNELIMFHFTEIANHGKKSVLKGYVDFGKNEVSRLFKVVHSSRKIGDIDGSYSYSYDLPCHADMFHRNELPKTHQPLPAAFLLQLAKLVEYFNLNSRVVLI